MHFGVPSFLETPKYLQTKILQLIECVDLELPVGRKKPHILVPQAGTNILYIGLSPLPVTVTTTRIITFLVGDPYKPSFATVTGRGDNPNYIILSDLFSPSRFWISWVSISAFLSKYEMKQKRTKHLKNLKTRSSTKYNAESDNRRVTKTSVDIVEPFRNPQKNHPR